MLRVLRLGSNRELKDISPLSSCTDLETLDIDKCTLITSLAPLSKLTHLKLLCCSFIHFETSVLPLAVCNGLGRLCCNGNAVDLAELRRRSPSSILIIYEERLDLNMDLKME
jgi:hypothetical protein